MDEYLFILMAKLRADIAKLEREKALADSTPTSEEVPPHRSPRARRSAPNSPDVSWVVPAHGMRGWS